MTHSADENDPLPNTNYLLLRAQMAENAIRTQAHNDGLDTVTGQDIDAPIKKHVQVGRKIAAEILQWGFLFKLVLLSSGTPLGGTSTKLFLIRC